ncbi:unknown [Methanothermobacter thermautotrophicus str. Delta H]|uniref:Uncharacterized protein n=1 Tax=Methanothermobacter thermautotrophicus (strain ATCC 29096 / DSM 1053 / JCM 10044 / NBRC 100330 / Delta H) TaxID=187420 RepID=O26400_METTH|nr:unknown [Methanothermobacter thermautotrophicus str. Delta H]
MFKRDQPSLIMKPLPSLPLQCFQLFSGYHPGNATSGFDGISSADIN